MALIKCPECGAEVSSSAATCPRCGFAVAEETGAGRLSITFSEEGYPTLRKALSSTPAIFSSDKRQIFKGKWGDTFTCKVTEPTEFHIFDTCKGADYPKIGGLTGMPKGLAIITELKAGDYIVQLTQASKLSPLKLQLFDVSRG